MTHPKPFVYIAGPYSKPYPVYNTRNAMLCWERLWNTRVITPIVPHVTMFIDLLTPRPYEDWLQFDKELLRRCDALLRLDGDSTGADEEVRLAISLGIPVFHDEAELISWASTWQPNIK